MLQALLLCASLLAAPLSLWAADPPAATRAQALKAAAHPDASVRRLAVARLGEIGTMADAEQLAAQLHDDDPPVRQLTEAALWQIWSRSGDRAIDALFLRGLQQMQAAQLREALATFSTITARKPGFAEGWNKRATVYYLLGQFDLSMKDCDEVLKRNPRHFGALSGYGQMYLAAGDLDRALPFFQRALKVNPNMEGVAQTVRLIEVQKEEKRRRMI